jgi:uncharacterized lipoprotein YddW (UPF0748 family)
LYSQHVEAQEMRAVWIATAKNIDYPSNKYLTSEQQQKEFTDILDMYQKIGMNAIMFQIRPAADAFYPSPYEPWSEWLTGNQGKAPDPYYDPLKFMIDETHKRGMEFHAWINPFRAVANIETADIAENHITKTNPEWFFTYGINTYFNPGIPEVRNYVTEVIDYVVRNYDIDGVHFDDYFYPYPVKDENNSIIPVPDNATFGKYGNSYNNIEDWRRNNMNLFIKEVADSIKNIKPYLKFGIAPSGVWRNKSRDPEGSDTRGFEHYDYLYADVVSWLKNGWIDYVAPQIYWNIGYKYADYKTLVEWWNNHTYGRHLYIGQGVYMADTNSTNPAWRNPQELPNQMRINREYSNVKGSIFYKTDSFKKNVMGFNDSLRTEFYAYSATTPVMAWLPPRNIIKPDTNVVIIAEVDNVKPLAPTDIWVTKMGAWYRLSWVVAPKGKEKFEDEAVKFKVYKFSGFTSKYVTDDDLYLETDKNYIMIKKTGFMFKKEYSFTVTGIDKAGNESKAGKTVYIKLKKK